MFSEVLHEDSETFYEFMVDHRSYTHNLSSCEIKA